VTVDLDIGDIIVDLVTGVAGILISRYNLANCPIDDPLTLWAWDVYWVGKEVEKESRLQTWTEYGLTNIIKAGTFVHHKNI
tara:strand:+ start:884 stop:1126 length:243 start_codon:yes stop_codon:yes gene_type:complete